MPNQVQALSTPTKSFASRLTNSSRSQYKPCTLKVALLHIPKTGGTILRDVVEGADAGIHWVASESPQKWAFLWPRLGHYDHGCNPLHTPVHWMTLHQRQVIYGDRSIFTLARHPYDRAISQFKYMCKSAPHLLERLGYNATKCWPNMGLFMAYVSTHVARLSQRGKEAALYDCHLIPQYDYARGVDNVFCTMAEVQKFLQELGFAHGRIERLHERPSYAAWYSEFTDQALSVLNSIYKHDFDLCGFKAMFPRTHEETTAIR